MVFDTPEDAAIVHDLSHAPFMAWLEEVCDQRDAKRMALLTATSRARPCPNGHLYCGGLCE